MQFLCFDVKPFVMAGKSKDLLSNFDIQLLTVEPNYVTYEEIDRYVRPQDDSNHVRMQRAQVIFFAGIHAAYDRVQQRTLMPVPQASEFSKLHGALSQISWLSDRQIQGMVKNHRVLNVWYHCPK